MGKGEKKKSSMVNALLFSWFRWKSYFHSEEISFQVITNCNKSYLLQVSEMVYTCYMYL